MINYHTNHCFTCTELYNNVDPAKGNITTKFAGKNHVDSKREYCGYVLTYFFFLVFLDIIENNTTFEFPMKGKHWSHFYVKCFQDEDFKRLYAGGKFLGIDFLKSEFKGYQIFYQGNSGSRIKEKPIYISNNMKNYFYSQINSGKQYY